MGVRSLRDQTCSNLREAEAGEWFGWGLGEWIMLIIFLNLYALFIYIKNLKKSSHGLVYKLPLPFSL